MRELFPTPAEPAAAPPLTEKERARLRAFTTAADRHLRLAGVLTAADFTAESRASTIAAATALAGALAVAARAEPPNDLAASLRAPALARWGAATLAVQALADSSEKVPDTVPAALRALLDPLLNAPGPPA
jgi:hypothetical protein